MESWLPSRGLPGTKRTDREKPKMTTPCLFAKGEQVGRFHAPRVDWFLGGRSLPWWILSISIDVTLDVVTGLTEAMTDTFREKPLPALFQIISTKPFRPGG